MKTLKDLEEDPEYNYGILPDEEGYKENPGRNVIPVDELMDAAIDWIEAIYEDKESYDTSEDRKNKKLSFHNDCIVSWIKHFFNLEELGGI